jgi:uracil-DNA glycosylase
MDSLLKKIKQCQICKEFLPNAPKPILNFSSQAKILIVGQAPGIKAHDSGKPWNDASGERLRDWLGVRAAQFYDPTIFAIVPMGFCYPGKGKSGDLPPRPECANHWMHQVLAKLKNIELKILIGTYSQEFFLKNNSGQLTETVKNWKKYQPAIFPLPHPSPRNNIWLKKNQLTKQRRGKCCNS